MAVNLRDQFDVTVDDGRSRLYNEQAEAAGMWAPARSYHSTRIGTDINANNADETSLRNAGRHDEADALAQRTAALLQQQAAYAPEIGRVEDIGTKNGYLSDGLNWFGTQVGMGVGSMQDPVAVAAAGSGAVSFKNISPLNKSNPRLFTLARDAVRL